MDGLAPVQVEDDSGDGLWPIDTSGQVVIEPRFESMRLQAESCQGRTRGRRPAPLRLHRPERDDGRRAAVPGRLGLHRRPRARVGVGDGSGRAPFGFIDPGGGMVIEPAFEHFSEGLAAVAVDGRWGYIDRTGDWVIEPCFSYASSFMAWGLAEVDLADTDAGTGERDTVDG